MYAVGLIPVCPGERRSSATNSILLCVALFFLVSVPNSQAEDCTPVSPGTVARITQYLAKRLTTANAGAPTVQNVGGVANTCYQKLLVTVAGDTRPVVMYLSPDRRFLSSTVYDLSADPGEEVAQIAAEVQSLLLRDDSPRLTGHHSQVVLVEFGDLECPYCKRFREWYDGLSSTLRDQTTLVFKHLPLEIHPWALTAAVLTACTSKQSSDAFWTLEGYLLAHQGELNATNITDRVMTQLSTIRDIDPQQVTSCVKGGPGTSMVTRDQELAAQLAVHSTPTLFINGRRVVPLQSKDDLERLLGRELETASVSISGQH